MGTWSHESFGNDVAGDWTGPLQASGDLAYVEKTLQTVLDVGGGYLEMDEACEAVAAAEVIARLQGNFGVRDTYSGSVDGWVERTRLVPSRALAEKALQALDRIVSEPSELLELWQEADNASAWLAAISDLRRRIET